MDNNFTTPSKQSQDIGLVDRGDTCSICLSPFARRVECVVKTRCRHFFHKSCLEEATTRKSECPNCRAALSPSKLHADGNPSNSLKSAIIAAAQRGRSAVRRAMVARTLQGSVV